MHQPRDEIELLVKARTGAQRLVEQLEREAREALDDSSRRLDPEEVGRGEEAMGNAIAAAQRALAAIESAIEAEQSLPEESKDDRDRR